MKWNERKERNGNRSAGSFHLYLVLLPMYCTRYMQEKRETSSEVFFVYCNFNEIYIF
jgi:hypothetical protein